ncbi:MAG: hypothetical protein WAU65_02170 [Candidatus Nanoarchaeia archaeon]
MESEYAVKETPRENVEQAAALKGLESQVIVGRFSGAMKVDEMRRYMQDIVHGINYINY